MAESRLLAITFVSGTCKQQNSHLIKFDKMVYVTCGIVFFEDREGKAPVLEWLDSQPLHGFQKNTAAVEEFDKKIGRSRMAEHSERLARAVRKTHKKK
jgi:hypothetical protein